jgi:bifunctional non-homologous end joining protein LigD
MGLHAYHKKRSFSRTPEPKGVVHKTGKALRFVVQKHAATRLHYDFRLEMDGVLKSWAVPKGPSLNPADKHLAVIVEDHPYDYRTFEGVIPEGNYGAGNVIIWDEGTYEALGPIPDSMTEEEYLLKQLSAGSIKIVMHGSKLKGEFALVKFKRAGDKNWLLIKHDDQYASTRDILKQDRSVVSGKTVQNIGSDDEGLQQAQKDGKKSRFPHDISPMLAVAAEHPFSDPDWIYEIKWDGYRALTEIHNNTVTIYSRNKQDYTRRYPVIADALSGIEHSIVLDGELVVLDKAGRSQFQLLQDYHDRKAGKLVYYIFDILYLDGYDLRALPLIERKTILEKTITENDAIKLSSYIEEHGEKLFKKVQQKGLEGIIAKRKSSTYQSRRRSDWKKIKQVHMQEAVICGFTEPNGSRKGFGSLVLGVYENNELRYVGHAGGGLNQEQLQKLRAQLNRLITVSSPFTHPPQTNTPATWVLPHLVCQVSFTEWTQDGLLRHPVYIGLRDDKDPRDVQREDPRARPQPITQVQRTTARKSKVSQARSNRRHAELTNLNKIFWPEEGYTKGDLIQYYESIADYILPYLKDRPISLNRFPNGIHGENFFQKDLVHRPDWVQTVPLYSESDNRNLNWLICNNVETLLYIANLGSIEINPWNSRYTNPNHPDYLIIDLDPEGIPFSEVIRVALSVKELLDGASIDAFLKTSGKTGLHILIPLRARYTYTQTKQFAEIIARTVFTRLPETTSVVRNPKKREHKIYIDFLQNREGQTIAAPYCVRPVAKALVSTPLEWNELTPSLNPADFTIKTIHTRLAKKGDIWEPFRKHKGIDMLKSLKKINR